MCGAHALDIHNATIHVTVLTVLFASMLTNITTVDKLQAQFSCLIIILTPLSTKFNTSGVLTGGIYSYA